MKFKNSAIVAVAMVLTTSVACASEDAWSKNSAGDISLFVTLQRFRIYADHCSTEVPLLKPEFERRMENLSLRMEDISRRLLASDRFKGMRNKPVPVEIIAALKDNLDDAKHNFERLDAASSCPKMLRKLGDTDDESLKSDLTEVLAAVQNMIQMLEKQGAR